MKVYDSSSSSSSSTLPNNDNKIILSQLLHLILQNIYIRTKIIKAIEELSRLDRDNYNQYHKKISPQYLLYRNSKSVKDENIRRRCIYTKGRSIIGYLRKTPKIPSPHMINRDNTLDMISKYAFDWSFLKHYLPQRSMIDITKRTLAINSYCHHPNANLMTLEHLLDWSPDFEPIKSLLDVVSKNGNLELLKYLESRYPHLQFTEIATMNATVGGHVNILEHLHDKLKRLQDQTPNLIYSAAKNGHFRAVKWLFEYGMTFSPESFGAACRHGFLDIAVYLYLRGKVSIGMRQIIGVAKNGHMQVLEFLDEKELLSFEDRIFASRHAKNMDIFRFLNPNPSVQVIQEVIDNAALNRNHDLLVDIISEIQQGNREGGEITIGRNTIRKICDCGYLDVLELLYNSKIQTVWRNDMLETASKNGNFDMVNFFLDKTSVMITENIIGAAAKNGHVNIVKLFLDRSTEIQVITVFDKVAFNGHLAMIRLLHTDERCILDRVTTDALDSAAKNGHLDVVKYLHKNRTEGGTTVALEWTAKQGFKDVVEYLDKNIKLSGQCSKKAIDWAAENGHFEIVQYLFYNRTEGCSVYAMNRAAKNGYLEIVEYLHNNGQSCTSDAFDWSAFYGHLAVLKFLCKHRKEGFSPAAMSVISTSNQKPIIDFLAKNYPQYRSILLAKQDTPQPLQEKKAKDDNPWSLSSLSIYINPTGVIAQLLLMGIIYYYYYSSN